MSKGDSERDKIVEGLIKEALQKIGEHVESVHVFVTYHSDGESATTRFSMGQGNSYATKGAVAAWLSEEDELARRNVDDSRDDED